MLEDKIANAFKAIIELQSDYDSNKRKLYAKDTFPYTRPYLEAVKEHLESISRALESAFLAAGVVPGEAPVEEENESDRPVPEEELPQPQPEPQPGSQQ